MYLIRLANGEEAIFRTVQELGAGIRKGVVGPKASIFHRRSNEWLPVETHPHFRFAQSLAGGGAPAVAEQPEAPSVRSAPAALQASVTPPATPPAFDARTIPDRPASALPFRPDTSVGSSPSSTVTPPPAGSVDLPVPPAPKPVVEAPAPPSPPPHVDRPAPPRPRVEPLVLETPYVPPPAPAPAPVPAAASPMRPRASPGDPPAAARPATEAPAPVRAFRRRGLGASGMVVTGLCLCIGLLAGWRLRVAGGPGRPAPAIAASPSAREPARRPADAPMQLYVPAPAPSTLERGRPMREAVSLAAETPAIAAAPRPIDIDPLDPVSRGELVARYESSYAVAWRQLDSDLVLVRFPDALAPSTLAQGREALRGRRIVAAAANIVTQFRRREVMIDRAYADSAEFQARRAGWSDAERRAWNARASLRESFESSDMAESMLSDADSLLAILAASRYRLAGDSIRFDDAAAGRAWTALRTRVAARSAEDLAPERHPTLAAVRRVVAPARLPIAAGSAP